MNALHGVYWRNIFFLPISAFFSNHPGRARQGSTSPSWLLARMLGIKSWDFYILKEHNKLHFILKAITTQSPTKRFLNHRSCCNSEKSNSSGLAKHFANGGCPNDLGREKDTLIFTLVDYLDTTEEELQLAGHIRGPQCRCDICQKLKSLEDKFILRSGTFYTNGLNTRDEVKNQVRCHWWCDSFVILLYTYVKWLHIAYIKHYYLWCVFV